MWVVKAHGVTFYVNHVSAELPWSTKETPDNEHTKGSIKFPKCKLVIDDYNCATITKLGIMEALTLDHPRIVHARIIARNGGKFHAALQRGEFQHSKIKYITGSCTTGFIVCDLLDSREATMAALKYTHDFRVMVPNESYYKMYDRTSGHIIANDSHEYDDYDDYDDGDDDE